MTRKSKRLELNEAIRRGQAKIAEGLKTGQMRSDQLKTQPGLKDKKDFVPPSPKMPFENRGVFLTSKKKSAYYNNLSSQTKSRILLYAVSVVVLALGILFVLTVIKPNPSKSVQDREMINQSAETEARTTEEEQTRNRFNLFGRKKTETAEPQDTGDKQGTAKSETQQGDNVIWIQSIALDRKDELKPVMDFFKRKGIETEIVVDRTSNLAVLVTKAGFEQNPVKKGTEGYELLLQIKALGSVYVQETQDTKFGQKPFQDVLGYKR